jgi:4-oxalocrotonate tautomerase
MPHVIVMYPGRSEHQKTQLAEAIVEDVMAFANVGDDGVSVAIEEVTPGRLGRKGLQAGYPEQPRQALQKSRIQSPSIARTAQEPRH